MASLRTLLLALDDECKNPQSSFQKLPLAQKGELAARLQDCKADLRSVKKILHDFRSLDTRDAQYRDRFAFTTGKQAAIREKIATHSVRLQQLLTGINVSTFSRIERNTEATYLSLLEIHAKLDKIRIDISSGNRDAVAVEDTDEVVALEDEILDDNMTEVDVDVSFEVHQWINQVNNHMSRPTNGYHQTRSPSPSESDASPAVNASHLPTEHVDESAHNATLAAYVTCEGKRLSAMQTPGSCKPTSLARDKNNMWTAPRKALEAPLSFMIFGSSKPLPKLTTHDTWYTLDYTLEEVFTEITRHINVRRRALRTKHQDIASFEDISLNVKIKKGFREHIAVRYLEAGNQESEYTESLVFMMRRVSINGRGCFNMTY